MSLCCRKREHTVNFVPTGYKCGYMLYIESQRISTLIGYKINYIYRHPRDGKSTPSIRLLEQYLIY